MAGRRAGCKDGGKVELGNLSVERDSTRRNVSRSHCSDSSLDVRCLTEQHSTGREKSYISRSSSQYSQYSVLDHADSTELDSP